MPNLKVTMSDFEFNVHMDESLFSVEPPAGYEVTVGQYKTTDDSPGKEKDLIEMFRYYSEVSGGRFPELLDLMWLSDTVRHEEWWARNLRLSHKPMAKREQGGSPDKIQRGMKFTACCRRKPNGTTRAKAFRSARPTSPSSGTARRMPRSTGSFTPISRCVKPARPPACPT